jgi:hypothetical protein
MSLELFTTETIAESAPASRPPGLLLLAGGIVVEKMGELPLPVRVALRE